MKGSANNLLLYIVRNVPLMQETTQIKIYKIREDTSICYEKDISIFNSGGNVRQLHKRFRRLWDTYDSR